MRRNAERTQKGGIFWADILDFFFEMSVAGGQVSKTSRLMDDSVKKRGAFVRLEFSDAVDVVAAGLAKLGIVTFVTNNNLIIFCGIFASFAWDGGLFIRFGYMRNEILKEIIGESCCGFFRVFFAKGTIIEELGRVVIFVV